MANGNKSRRMLHLARKWREGSITEAEKKEFDEWFDAFDDAEMETDGVETRDILKERLYARIQERSGLDIKQPAKRLYTRIAAAASILLILSAGGYFFFRKHATPVQIAQNTTKDIAPGGNMATLTLSDGRKIVLSKVNNGTIASQGKTLINKTADGQLAYAASGNSTEVLYNTLATKRGEQYAVVLPDGSKVWLNAASSLRYPVSFNGKSRTVELTGEAFFEVIHNAAQPFRVKVKSETVEDIGTHFNINAYNDEPVLKTTLIEGAVRVSSMGQTVVLRPGQSAVSKGQGKITVAEADPDEATAWKDGYFNLNSENLASVMRKVSRWYDADVTFEDPKLQNQVFGGTLTASRFKNVSRLLNKLQLTGAIHYRIENKKIIITN